MLVCIRWSYLWNVYFIGGLKKVFKTLKIKNIQSHKDTELEFVNGVNVIVGSSNNGKSAILRALYWLRYNRPLGTDILLSHWCIDDKGNQKNKMEVTLETDGGVVSRCRGKSENQYIVNGEIFNVVKTDVPDDVENLLKLTETNIQKQQDAPFLLSLTGGQVAQYFNRVVKLDVIDDVLSKAESLRRKCNSDIKVVDGAISKANETIDNFGWVLDFEKKVNVYEKLSGEEDKFNAEIENVENLLIDYNKLLGCSYNTAGLKKIIESIDKYVGIEDDCVGRIDELEKTLYEYANVSDNCVYDFSTENTKLKRIDVYNEKLQVIEDSIDKLNCELSDYANWVDCIEDNQKKIEELKSELPEVCPLCGGKLDKEVLC